MRARREVSESYWAAECRRDVDGVMAHYHPDDTDEDPSGLRRGHREIRQAYGDSARQYPALEVRIVREFRGAPDCSALEYDAVLRVDRSLSTLHASRPGWSPIGGERMPWQSSQ